MPSCLPHQMALLEELLGKPEEVRVAAGLEAQGLGELGAWFDVFRTTQVLPLGALHQAGWV